MKDKVNKPKWEKTFAGNSILNYGEFYISYRESRDSVPPALQAFNALGAAMGLKTGEQETALCTPNEEPKWRILTGDFRKEYEKAAPKGLAACLAVYEANKAAHRNDWSTD